MANYRTALSRARGLGSAKHGAGHWISERVSSIALVPLTVWASAFQIENFRAGLTAVGQGMHDASASLGLKVIVAAVSVMP